MRKLTTNGMATAEAIGRHEPFSTHGALRAESGRPSYCYGARLNREELARFESDRSDIVYTVYSYATPIAWVTADGTAYRVAQKFSVTTTRHQSNLYRL